MRIQIFPSRIDEGACFLNRLACSFCQATIASTKDLRGLVASLPSCDSGESSSSSSSVSLSPAASLPAPSLGLPLKLESTVSPQSGLLTLSCGKVLSRARRISFSSAFQSRSTRPRML